MFIHWGLYAIPAGICKGVKMEEKNRPYVSEWIQYVFQQSHDELIVQLPQKQLNENGYALEIELKR
jgi:hypothetical protein